MEGIVDRWDFKLFVSQALGSLSCSELANWHESKLTFSCPKFSQTFMSWHVWSLADVQCFAHNFFLVRFATTALVKRCFCCFSAQNYTNKSLIRSCSAFSRLIEPFFNPVIWTAFNFIHMTVLHEKSYLVFLKDKSKSF